MGAQSTVAALTETRGDPAPAAQRLYVGIDVGRRHHVVASIDQTRMANGSWERAPVRRIGTNGAGFRDLTDWLAASGYDRDQIRVGVEPTGSWYALTIAAWLNRHGYHVAWLQNWTLHERRQLAIGKQTKTDALDARLIARILYEHEHHGLARALMPRPPRSADGLRLLVRNRHRLVEQQTRYRLQLTHIEDAIFPELKDFFLKSITAPAARRLLETYPTPAAVAAAPPGELYELVVRRARASVLAAKLPGLQRAAADSAGLTADTAPILEAQRWLLVQLRNVEDEIVSVEKSIAIALETLPSRELEIMDSLPAMSTMLKAVLVATIGDISGFRSDRQLRKMCGWYSELRESGSSFAKARLGNSGNRLARREIWFWAMHILAPRHQPTPFRAYYRRLHERGMPGPVAIGHLAGKLISVLFFCLRHDRTYDPQRHAKALGLTTSSAVSAVTSDFGSDFIVESIKP